MKSKLSKLVLLLAVVVLFSTTFTSCKKKKAPVIPSENTFVMPHIKGEINNAKRYGGGYENFSFAILNMAFWTTVTDITMLVPITAYGAAVEESPRHLKGNRWVWEYKFDVLIKTYKVQLFAETNNDQVKWEMHISLEGIYDDFVWFTGTHNADRTKGQWIVNKSPLEDVPFIQVDWTRNKENSKVSVKYTVIEPQAEVNKSYVEYGNNQVGNFDTYFNVYSSVKDQLTQIELNTEIGNGRIKAPHFYKDNIWHCWNNKFVDDFCSGETAK